MAREVRANEVLQYMHQGISVHSSFYQVHVVREGSAIPALDDHAIHGEVYQSRQHIAKPVKTPSLNQMVLLPHPKAVSAETSSHLAAPSGILWRAYTLLVPLTRSEYFSLHHSPHNQNDYRWYV